MATEPWRLALVAVIVAAWTVAAVIAVLVALESRRRTRLAYERAREQPELPPSLSIARVELGADGRIHPSQALLAWFAVDRAERLGDLAHGAEGLDRADAEALQHDAQRLGAERRGFRRVVRGAGGRNIFLVEGSPAVPGAERSGGVLWFTDLAGVRWLWEELEQRVSELEGQLDRANALLSAAPWPIWRRESSLRIVQVNDAFTAAVDASDASAAIAAQVELEERGLAEPARLGAERAQATGQTQQRVATVVTGGALRTMEVYDVPLPGGEVAGYACDVTGEHETRSELSRLERAQIAAFDRLSAGIARFEATGTLVFCNSHFSRLLGLDPRALDEEPDLDVVFDLAHEARRLPEPPDYPAWRAERRRWLSEPEPVEETWALLDGSVLRVIPQPHPTGGLLLLIEDQTRQLRLQSSLDTLRRVQQATIEQLYEAIAVFGADGRLRVWNKRFAHVCALPADALEGEPHAEALMNRIAAVLKEPERVYGLRDLIFTATTLRQARAGRVSGSGPDGRTMDYRAVPLPDGNALLIFLDVTDSQRMEEALRERNEALRAAERVQGAFITSIASELKTPLTSILGFAELLSESYSGPLTPSQRDSVAAILSASGQLDQLINDLIDAASAYADTAVQHPAEIDVAAFLEQLGDEVEGEMAFLGRQLERRIDPLIGSVEADARRLRQALKHLLANAAHWAASGASIRIEARGARDSVELSVRVGRSRAVADGGAAAAEGSAAGADELRGGLGLMLLRGFAEHHGGRVEISQQQGAPVIVLQLRRRLTAQQTRLAG
jgi:signal transduction histidine kinase